MHYKKLLLIYIPPFDITSEMLHLISEISEQVGIINMRLGKMCHLRCCVKCHRDRQQMDDVRCKMEEGIGEVEDVIRPLNMYRY